MHNIYMDNNASTAVAPEVASVMRAALEAAFGNPSSGHWAGAPAKAAVDKAREQVAAFLGCTPDEIVFTSGGTEANNHVLKGTFFGSDKARPHFIASVIEHPAILNPLEFLKGLGAEVTLLPVDGAGCINPDDLRRAITPRTELVSLMHANNETGTIQPIEACAQIAHDHGIRFHTDAAQSVGKISTRVDELGVDMMSLAGHKFHAPKGVGALYIRKGVRLEPFMHGAAHERGNRAGTESVVLLAGLGQAAELVSDLAPMAEIGHLRDRFWRALEGAFGKRVALNGQLENALPNTLNVSFIGCVGAQILAGMPEVAASTGSACHSGQVTLSPVLKAMGVAPEVGMGAIRFSLGRGTTSDEIDHVVARLTEVCAALN